MTLAIAAGGEAHGGVQRGIDGHVYIDADGDGARSTGDPPVAGVRVWLDAATVTVSDADGAYRLEAPTTGGLVWAQTPDGYAPGPVWRPIVAGDSDAAAIDLALVPRPLTGPLRFVAVSDAHVGKEGYGGEGGLDDDALRAALDQALALAPAPAFYVMTGDITNRDADDEVAQAAAVLRSYPVPFVPVAGNHDWVDGGANYRAAFGPPVYSFDLGGVHFVVLNDNPRTDPDLDFLRRDLAGVGDDRLVIGFVHRPPKDRAFAALEAAGIDYLFTGHWHANRYVRGDGMVQINTEPLVRGGLDFTPAGYRIVTVSGREVSLAHHAIVETPVAALVWPGEVCVPAGPLTAIAAVELGGAEIAVTASLDGGPAVALTAAGGWARRGDLGAIAPGSHQLVLAVDGTDGLPALPAVRSDFATCGDGAQPPTIGAWTQHQGGADHRGAAAQLIAPPLRALWATTVGGHLQGGSVAVADGRVFAPIVDLTDGTSGGVVALDATTGAELWRHVTGHAVRNTPAVANGIVVIPANDGVIHAVDAATGAVRWTYDLGAGVDDNRAALTAAPTIADGVVYVGVIGRFAAIDLASGQARWTAEPAPKMVDQASYAAATVAGDVVIAAFGLGGDGVVAWDRATGRERWRLDKDASTGVHAAPISDGARVLVINGSTLLQSVSPGDGATAWARQVNAKATPLSMAAGATPALAGDLLFVPTQYESLAAVDVRDGRVRWRADVGTSRVHVAHNQRVAHAIPGSPVIAGDVLWVGGGDGVLRAFEPSTGALLWKTALGAPILSGLAAAGDVLFVGSFDGTLRAFATDGAAPPIARAPAAPSLGTARLCGTRQLVVVMAVGGGLVLAALVAFVWRLTRPRRLRLP